MEYARIENNHIRFAPRRLTVGENTVYNPPAEMYLAQGWKPVVFTGEPEAPEGCCCESGWEEQEGEIVQTWTLAPLPDDIGGAEAFDIIFGGAG